MSTRGCNWQNPKPSVCPSDTSPVMKSRHFVEKFKLTPLHKSLPITHYRIFHFETLSNNAAMALLALNSPRSHMEIISHKQNVFPVQLSAVLQAPPCHPSITFTAILPWPNKTNTEHLYRNLDGSIQEIPFSPSKQSVNIQDQFLISKSIYKNQFPSPGSVKSTCTLCITRARKHSSSLLSQRKDRFVLLKQTLFFVTSKPFRDQGGSFWLQQPLQDFLVLVPLLQDSL